MRRYSKTMIGFITVHCIVSIALTAQVETSPVPIPEQILPVPPPILGVDLSSTVGTGEANRVDIESTLPSGISTNARKHELLKVFKEQNHSGHEAVVRLILAETMASHCPSIDDGDQRQIRAIMEGIAKVIKNRVVIRSNEKELTVVFAKDQFNSSVAQYPCSEVEGFLNPQTYNNRVKGVSEIQLWTMAKQAYEKAWREKVFSEKSDQVRNYYLHQHHRRGSCHFKPPAWVNPSKEVALDGPLELAHSVRSCIGFYKL